MLVSLLPVLNQTWVLIQSDLAELNSLPTILVLILRLLRVSWNELVVLELILRGLRGKLLVHLLCILRAYLRCCRLLLIREHFIEV